MESMLLVLSAGTALEKKTMFPHSSVPSFQWWPKPSFNIVGSLEVRASFTGSYLSVHLCEGVFAYTGCTGVPCSEFHSCQLGHSCCSPFDICVVRWVSRMQTMYTQGDAPRWYQIGSCGCVCAVSASQLTWMKLPAHRCMEQLYIHSPRGVVYTFWYARVNEA